MKLINAIAKPLFIILFLILLANLYPHAAKLVPQYSLYFTLAFLLTSIFLIAKILTSDFG